MRKMDFSTDTRQPKPAAEFDDYGNKILCTMRIDRWAGLFMQQSEQRNIIDRFI